MLLIFGLGNPGAKYQSTRHNVGFLVIDELAKQLGTADLAFKEKFKAELVKTDSLVLAKPQTYMNQSGQAIRAILDFYQVKIAADIKNLYIIHDDLDIEFGQYKLQFGTGPKVHHGLQSIYQYLKTDQFWHVRVGIDNRAGDRSIPGEDFVLQNFTAAEQELLSSTIQHLATELVQRLI
jgi:PTH1 family peptidyl-tRNA hydrolase